MAKLVEGLRLLAAEGVEVILVGMLSAVVRGAPATTFDIDIVHRRTPQNVDRLLRVLLSIDAVHRGDPRKLPPTAERLMGPGHQLLSTRLGDIDCLGALHGGETYDDLLPHSDPIPLGDGATLRVLRLETLIEIKRAAGRAKDRAVLPLLEETLEALRTRQRG
ncbi:MAG: hypothetical protein HY898_11855 [Deltaproteobacteria bacterium]|nr:hypothetical protein [Deltaproteobacteria bacterium]